MRPPPHTLTTAATVRPLSDWQQRHLLTRRRRRRPDIVGAAARTVALVFIVAAVVLFVGTLLGPAEAGAAPYVDPPSLTDPIIQPITTDVVGIIRAAATERGADPALMLRIAHCESRFNPGARGPGGAAGLYQFIATTWQWASTAAGWPGASAYNAHAAADTAAWLLTLSPRSGGGVSHWKACL